SQHETTKEGKQKGTIVKGPSSLAFRVFSFRVFVFCFRKQILNTKPRKKENKTAQSSKVLLLLLSAFSHFVFSCSALGCTFSSRNHERRKTRRHNRQRSFFSCFPRFLISCFRVLL